MTSRWVSRVELFPSQTFIDIEVVDDLINALANVHDQSDMEMELCYPLSDVNPALLGNDGV